ncbi:hypothetical protein HY500_03860 [Candidatus Woesearchaeota archaeon]|nr:hypothetical protein [Candidatus Woesearchaeota archaeon]
MTLNVQLSDSESNGIFGRVRGFLERRRQQAIFDRFMAMPKVGTSYCPSAWYEISYGNSQMMFFGYDRHFLEVRFQDQTYQTLIERLSRGGEGDRAYAILPRDEEGAVLTRLARETERVHILRSSSDIRRGFSILSPFYVLTFDPICELAPLITHDETLQRTTIRDFDLVRHYEKIFERERARIIASPRFSYES